MDREEALITALNVIRKLVDRIEELQEELQEELRGGPCPEGFVLVSDEKYESMENEIKELQRLRFQRSND